MPRLRSHLAEQYALELTAICDHTQISFDQSRLVSEGVWFAGPGGNRLTVSEMMDLRKGIERLAESAGFPDTKQRASFDRACISYFAETLAKWVSPGEGLEDEVWMWFAINLAPDFTVWRFPNPNRSRLLGGNRNMFGRLWTRSQVFDRGLEHPSRWGVASRILEDAMVAICERPSVVRDQRLALAIGEAWLNASTKSSGDALQQATRDVLKAVVARNEVICLASVGKPELSDFLDRCFRVALADSQSKER
ncbi:hypothetical protein V0U79_08945 [Hyphobacterium sp. HN65]|uniref:Uncharacterized protein n=1 Tax=Hyphobacterium lacteum TaxID=3116575 RepID=A0ABU7LRG3_9PROT|nr:hypothetical protein [Hyphobacterium sp. HN65]MEE2526491.1 hypothetical protein [Hyphobacterium sp. HN65]